ncbi:MULTISPECIES: hypothetical protein [Streptomyces]|uniref:NAD kinase n=1 Tax=Streptomyces venezuelae TaxID=54571 RepID=A0A5P2AKA8_STRVZ|nr:hypothetical protein [Streptomyces venezuelae]QES18613.1 hypothetical protein DEJ46_05530 [Streptomyces venezuelae]
MSLAPRAVLVHRTTEYEELLARHGTHGQAAFFLSARGRSVEAVRERHERVHRALAEVAGAVPLSWRQTRVERADLDRFLFGPEDVVVVVGQDGLVANAAKYLTGQPVIGIDADPGQNAGVLVRHRAAQARRLLPYAVGAGAAVDELTMVEAVTDDAQRLLALNEIYVGPPGHQTARYTLGLDGPKTQTGPETPAGPKTQTGPKTQGRPKAQDQAQESEAQASSGVLVGTGTGATGWLRSLWEQRSSALVLPAPADARLAWFVREAWPSPTTGTSRVEGLLDAGQGLRLTVESDRLVAFGDGVESDALHLTWGQTVRLAAAEDRLRLVG